MDEKVEELARVLCDTWYLTVDPSRPMIDAFDKIALRTQEHWREQAKLMLQMGWTKDA